MFEMGNRCGKLSNIEGLKAKPALDGSSVGREARSITTTD
jgi:hypothetical protein